MMKHEERYLQSGLKRLKSKFDSDWRTIGQSRYNIKKMYNAFSYRLIGALVPTMLVYILKSDVYWAILVYGLLTYYNHIVYIKGSDFAFRDYRNPYHGEGDYYIIPEYVLRGLAVSMIITALTHFAGYSNVWVTVCGVGGYCFGYAMDFGVAMTKYNEILRGLGVAMIVYAICMNSSLDIIPIVLLTLGSFLVSIYFWVYNR